MKKRLLVSAGIGLGLCLIAFLTVLHIDGPSKIQNQMIIQSQALDEASFWVGMTNQAKADEMEKKSDELQQQWRKSKNWQAFNVYIAKWICEWSFKISILIGIVGLIWPRAKKPITT